MISSYTKTSGQTFELADVWFSSTAGTSSATSQLAQLLTQYTTSSTSQIKATEGMPSTLGTSGTKGAVGTSLSINTVPSAVMTTALGTALTQYSNCAAVSSVSIVPIAGPSPLVATNTGAVNTTPLAVNTPQTSS